MTELESLTEKTNEKVQKNSKDVLVENEVKVEEKQEEKQEKY